MLENLRIVEIGEGMAVQVAGLMLGELGADVLKVERPGGDPARGKATFASWNRGKRSLVLDLGNEDGKTALAERLAAADVLLHQFSPAQAVSFGLDDAALAAAYPQLVVCGITGSPHNHPDVERSDDELLVGARLGLLYENDGHRGGPIVYRYRQAGWATSHLAASGILARLVARLETGKGGAAHTSLYQGLLSTLPLVWARNSEGPMPNPEPYPYGPRSMEQQLYKCQGGDWMQIMDPTRQFDYASLPTMWDVMAEGVDIDTEEGKIEAFSRRPIDAWIADFRAADIAVEPAYPMGEVLRHPEVKANGYSVEVDDPYFGKTIQANVPFHSDGELPLGRAAPQLGEGADVDWQPAAPRPDSSTPKDEVLQNVRVLDFGMFLAGPMGPSMMGDMGADVIKVEALTGDRIRFMHRFYQAAARSKRGIAIDLTNPAAQPIFERLLKWAEVVHHNMRFKGAAKLGLTAENIKRVNPKASFNYVSAYGQKGERGDWPGYDSIFNAIAGWLFENAGEGNPPTFNRPGTMDVTTAQSALVELMASLYSSRATGKPQATQTSLLGTSAFVQGERLIDADGKLTDTYSLTTDQTGFSPYHRIFEATGGEWVAVAAHSDAEQAAVRKILGGNEGQFADNALKVSAPELIAKLEAENVPCDAVMFEDAMNRFFDDPANRELNLVSSLAQPLYGTIEQPGAFWDFGEIPMVFKHACPAIGEHTDEIMREIGFSDAETADFRDKKIIV